MQGVKLIDSNGTPVPTSVYQYFLNAAIDYIAQESKVHVYPFTVLSEPHDYWVEQYMFWSQFKVYHYPVLSVQSITAVYPTGEVILLFPSTWVKCYPNAGQIMLVPTAGTLSQVLIGQGGSYLPLLDGRLSYMPQLFQLSYTAGFNLNAVPLMVNQAIGCKAALSMLALANNMAMEPGIGSKMISIDGLSQSTQVISGPYGPYSGMYRIYNEQLALHLQTLKDNYQGVNFTVV